MEGIQVPDPSPAVVESTTTTNDNIPPETRGTKRPATSDPASDASEASDNDNNDPIPTTNPDGTPLTKNQQKRLLRRSKWESGKETRRAKRRDKRHQKQARKHEEREKELALAAAEGREPVHIETERARRRKRLGTTVPVGIIVDCQFETYMLETELISLASQVTRSYSDNRGAQHPVHLCVSSYGGFLKARYETVLSNQHLAWKGVRFCSGDFVEAAREAKEKMASFEGDLIEVLAAPKEGGDALTMMAADAKRSRTAPEPEPEAEDVDRSIVYLTADSPYTLNRLEANTCYVVGGIIDKNREKGLCYKIARERKVRTAKLPIGEYMVLQHRHVLTTNHVVEIMLKWLETGDWGVAFKQVIPLRKGGKLKGDEDATAEAEAEAEAEKEDAADVEAKEVVEETVAVEEEKDAVEEPEKADV